MTPRSPILGLHHVTATVDDAQSDVTFAAGTLALRLVKTTINFDNHHVYHFYYGDDRGRPGTIWTTFPYTGYGVPVGRKGAGQVTATSFSVPHGSLEFWRDRLTALGIRVEEPLERFGERVLHVADPSGLVMELVETTRDSREPWITTEVDRTHAIRGVHSVTLTIRSPRATIDFMKDALGFDVVNEGPGRTRLAVRGDAPGRTMDVVDGPTAPAAMNGLGTVHHVAMAVETADDQLQMRRLLIERGVQVTPVLDRQYFQSIYFREPGGVLFEIATMAPGFLVDESFDDLGTTLKLPPWEEPYRNAIHAGLPPIVRP